jgi:hypothetical protein
MFEVEMMGYIRFVVSGKTLGFLHKDQQHFSPPSYPGNQYVQNPPIRAREQYAPQPPNQILDQYVNPDLEVVDTVHQAYCPDVDLVEVNCTDIVDRIDWLEAVAGILLPEAGE